MPLATYNTCLMMFYHCLAIIVKYLNAMLTIIILSSKLKQERRSYVATGTHNYMYN